MIHPNEVDKPDDHSDEVIPMWWHVLMTIVTVAAIALLTSALTGCADITPPNHATTVSERRAQTNKEVAMWRSISTMKSSEAQSNSAIVYFLTRKPTTSDYAAYAAAISVQNEQQGAVARSGVGIGATFFDWMVINSLAGKGGDSSVTVNGDSNTTGGHDAKSLKRTDVSATLTAGDGGGDEAVTLPAE